MRSFIGVSFGWIFYSLPAQAAPFLVAELHSGVVESAVTSSEPNFGYGASLGATFRLPDSTLRLYLLANVTQRLANFENQSALGWVAGDRDELDVVFSSRLLLPIAGPVRLFGEVGMGWRSWDQRLTLDGATFLEARSRMLFMTAVGLQVRLNERFSLGGKWMWDRAVGTEPLLEQIGLANAGARMSLLGHVGVHF